VARRRLAVALLVAPPLRPEVDGLRRALDSPTRGHVPAHLTLVPPVNVRDEDLAAALAVLRAAAGATAPFALDLGPAATFEPERAVVHLAVGGDVEALLALRDRVFVAPFVRPLDHDFIPHVTLSTGLPAARTAAAVAALSGFRARWEVDRLHLMAEDHPAWRPEADVPLGRAAVVGRGGLPLELTTSERLDPEASAFAAREWATFDRDERGVEWEEPQPFAIVARREGAVVGVATGSVQGDAAHLSDLLVAATERGTGVGSHLLAAVERLAADHGVGSITLHTAAGGRAEAFYRSRGWVEEARLPAWRTGLDFVRLRRRIFFS
jgi:2'-5' RNA ligase/N-acetylglutamate synthase-like GNAT family acetyltransferase